MWHGLKGKTEIRCLIQKQNKIIKKKKSTWNGWVMLERKFLRAINGEIDLM